MKSETTHRNAILEEAARIADAEAKAFDGGEDEGEVYVARTIANKIRALKTVQDGESASHRQPSPEPAQDAGDRSDSR